MAPLFSEVDLNKLWHDVQNEETAICAKFGKDLFNISYRPLNKLAYCTCTALLFFVFCLYPYCNCEQFFYFGGQSVSCRASLAALRLYGFFCDFLLCYYRRINMMMMMAPFFGLPGRYGPDCRVEPVFVVHVILSVVRCRKLTCLLTYSSRCVGGGRDAVCSTRSFTASTDDR